MRWPLRNQIHWQILALVLIAIVGVTIANIRSTAETNRRDLGNQIQEISRILTTSSFPLRGNVLEDMKSLSGADFVVTQSDGQITAKTAAAPRDLTSLKSSKGNSGGLLDLENRVLIGGQNYFYAVLPIRDGRSQPSNVHVFVSQQNYQRLRWQAIRGPLIIAAIVLPIAFLFSLVMANNVTRPLNQLKLQVQNVAAGNLQPIEVRRRDDEVRDLTLSVNEMVEQLKVHERQIQRNERLATLIKLGSGVAHNLRNCATGCKMAVELLGQQYPDVSQSENLDVANRQLTLMNKYIERFLKLAESNQIEDQGDGQPRLVNEEIELTPIFESVAVLLKPTAQHLGVDLSFVNTCQDAAVDIPEDDLEQLMINLINNAITAASENAVRMGKRQAYVRVEFALMSGWPKFELTVIDNGPGPPAELASKIFEPFVSGSRDGTGLGLTLVEEIVVRAGGEVSWCRVHDETRFSVELPRSQSIS